MSPVNLSPSWLLLNALMNAWYIVPAVCLLKAVLFRLLKATESLTLALFVSFTGTFLFIAIAWILGFVFDMSSPVLAFIPMFIGGTVIEIYTIHRLFRIAPMKSAWPALLADLLCFGWLGYLFIS